MSIVKLAGTRRQPVVELLDGLEPPKHCRARLGRFGAELTDSPDRCARPMIAGRSGRAVGSEPPLPDQFQARDALAGVAAPAAFNLIR